MGIMYAFTATERGIRERNSALYEEERCERLNRQRAAYEAHVAELVRLAEVKRLATERAAEELAAKRATGWRYKPTFREIERRACRLFKVTPSQVRSDRRHQDIVIVRQFIAYWAVRLTTLSLPQLGRLMGGRDHTTMLHHKRKYPERRAKMGRYLRPTR